MATAVCAVIHHCMTVLKNVQDEVVAAMEPSVRRVFIVPLLIVNRDTHFRWVAVIEAIGTLVVLGAPEVLWVIDVGVVVKPVPVDGGVNTAPRLTVCPLIGCGGLARYTAADQNAGYD